MSDQDFVSTHGGNDVLRQGTGAITEPTLNTTALRNAGKALLADPKPNPAPSATPSGQPNTATTSSVPSPVSPIQQIPIKVTDAAPAAPESTEGEPAVAESGQKVTATDPATGQKVEFDLLAIPDDATVRMKRNGEIVTVTGKEAKADAMRAAKFTHEMQQLRQREEQHAQRLEQAGILEQLVTDDQALASYIAQTRPHIVEALASQMGYSKAEAAAALATKVQEQATTPAAPVAGSFQITNPGELASLGEVDSLLSQRTSALTASVLDQVKKELGGVNETVTGLVQQEVQKLVRAEITTLRNAAEVQAFDVEINKTIDGILTANPALKAIPNIKENLRFEVRKMQPKSAEEMTEAFNTVAAGIVEGLEETYNTARKISVITKAEMEKSGIEPPVGTQPTFTRPLDYRDDSGKVSFKNIAEAAKAALRSA